MAHNPRPRPCSNSESAPIALAAIQYGLFLVPTLAYSIQRGFDLRGVFRLRGCKLGEAGTAALAGFSVWALVTAAETLRALSVGGGSGAASEAGRLLEASGAGSGSESLLLLALAPAVAEELCCRGYLLTSLRSQLGRIDAIALSSLLFALLHLAPEQIFRFTALGFACGLFAVGGTGSIIPAVVVHAAHNASALTVGPLLDLSSPLATAVALGAAGASSGLAAYLVYLLLVG